MNLNWTDITPYVDGDPKEPMTYEAWVGSIRIVVSRHLGILWGSLKAPATPDRWFLTCTASGHDVAMLKQTDIVKAQAEAEQRVKDQITANYKYVSEPVTDPKVVPGIDLTGDNTSVVEVEAAHAAGGHDVLYVHVDGRTIFRLCRPKELFLTDRRVPDHRKKPKIQVELEELRAWKKSALALFNSVNAVEVAKLLNMPLGTDVFRNLESALRRQADYIAALERDLKARDEH